MLRDLVQDLRYTALIIVKPRTVIAWHRQAFVCSGRGKVGTVRVDPEFRPTSAPTAIRTLP
jgi:hypothetical protein